MAAYRYGFYEVTFGSGHLVHCQVGKTYFIPLENTLSFISPGQVASWNIKEFQGNSLGYMLFFKSELLGWQNDLKYYHNFPFFQANVSPVYHLTGEQRSKIVEVMEKMYTEYQQFTAGSLEILRAYLVILLTESKRMLTHSKKQLQFANRAEELTYKFEQLVRQDLPAVSSLSDYADQLHISKHYLSECIKKTTGKGGKAIIIEYQLLEAKSMLMQTSWSISEIGAHLGFTEPSNFVKFFKRYTKQTPQAFRR